MLSNFIGIPKLPNLSGLQHAEMMDKLKTLKSGLRVSVLADGWPLLRECGRVNDPRSNVLQQSDSDYGGHSFNNAMHGGSVPMDQQPYGSMPASMNNEHSLSDAAQNATNAQNAIATSGGNNAGQTNGFSFTPPTVPSTKDGEWRCCTFHCEMDDCCRY